MAEQVDTQKTIKFAGRDLDLNEFVRRVQSKVTEWMDYQGLIGEERSDFINELNTQVNGIINGDITVNDAGIIAKEGRLSTYLEKTGQKAKPTGFSFKRRVNFDPVENVKIYLNGIAGAMISGKLSTTTNKDDKKQWTNKSMPQYVNDAIYGKGNSPSSEQLINWANLYDAADANGQRQTSGRKDFIKNTLLEYKNKLLNGEYNISDSDRAEEIAKIDKIISNPNEFELGKVAPWMSNYLFTNSKYYLNDEEKLVDEKAKQEKELKDAADALEMAKKNYLTGAQASVNPYEEGTQEYSDLETTKKLYDDYINGKTETNPVSLTDNPTLYNNLEERRTVRLKELDEQWLNETASKGSETGAFFTLPKSANIIGTEEYFQSRFKGNLLTLINDINNYKSDLKDTRFTNNRKTLEERRLNRDYNSGNNNRMKFDELRLLSNLILQQSTYIVLNLYIGTGTDKRKYYLLEDTVDPFNKTAYVVVDVSTSPKISKINLTKNWLLQIKRHNPNLYDKIKSAFLRVKSNKLGGKFLWGGGFINSDENSTNDTQDETLKIAEEKLSKTATQQKREDWSNEEVAGFNGGAHINFDNLSAIDYARISTVALDLGSLISADALGYGTAASAALGLGSTAVSLGADIADPSIGLGETLKNLGMGIGADVIGLIPIAGAAGKSTKIARTLVTLSKTLIPIFMSTPGLIDAGKSVENVINNGGKISREDALNIYNGLRTILGGSVRKNRSRHYQNKNIEARKNEKISSEESYIIHTDEGDVALSNKKDYDDIRNAFLKGKPDEANSKLKTALNRDQNDPIKIDGAFGTNNKHTATITDPTKRRRKKSFDVDLSEESKKLREAFIENQNRKFIENLHSDKKHPIRRFIAKTAVKHEGISDADLFNRETNKLGLYPLRKPSEKEYIKPNEELNSSKSNNSGETNKTEKSNEVNTKNEKEVLINEEQKSEENKNKKELVEENKDEKEQVLENKYSKEEIELALLKLEELKTKLKKLKFIRENLSLLLEQNKKSHIKNYNKTKNSLVRELKTDFNITPKKLNETIANHAKLGEKQLGIIYSDPDELAEAIKKLNMLKKGGVFKFLNGALMNNPENNNEDDDKKKTTPSTSSTSEDPSTPSTSSTSTSSTPHVTPGKLTGTGRSKLGDNSPSGNNPISIYDENPFGSNATSEFAMNPSDALITGIDLLSNLKAKIDNGTITLILMASKPVHVTPNSKHYRQWTNKPLEDYVGFVNANANHTGALYASSTTNLAKGLSGRLAILKQANTTIQPYILLGSKDYRTSVDKENEVANENQKSRWEAGEANRKADVAMQNYILNLKASLLSKNSTIDLKHLAAVQKGIAENAQNNYKRDYTYNLLTNSEYRRLKKNYDDIYTKLWNKPELSQEELNSLDSATSALNNFITQYKLRWDATHISPTGIPYSGYGTIYDWRDPFNFNVPSEKSGGSITTTQSDKNKLEYLKLFHDSMKLMTTENNKMLKGLSSAYNYYRKLFMQSK